jgi:ATP-binding cassette subfamily B protein/ATP-binding cassette subfamily C protein
MRLPSLRSIRTIPEKLSFLLSRKYKIFLIVLFILTLFLAFVETVGVSAIMPFITVASDPAMLDEGNYKFIFDFFGFTEKSAFIIAFGIAIIVFYIFRSIFNVTYTFVLTKYSLGAYRSFALNLFKVYFSIPYKHFVQKNSGEIIQIINGETNRVSRLLLEMMQIFAELFTVLMIYGFLLFVNWRMTLVLTAILAVMILLIVTFLLKKSTRQGVKLTKAHIKQSRILHEAFGNYKFVRLRGNEKDFYTDYEVSSRAAANANIINTTLNVLPRHLLENIGFSLLIGVVVYITWRMGSPESIIPIISMYALALYRMLPAVTRTLSNLNQIAFNQNSLNIVYDAIKQETEKEGSAQLSFDKSIKIDAVSFRYITGNEVLRNVSLEIRKGDSIALTGESGTGKTTLVDILIGINKPSSGALYIDDIKVTDENIRPWRKKIGYIPQNIYLFDGTVAENVTFSSKFDEDHLVKTLKMANIWDFLEKNNGIKTLVGEGGIQLSGGQKQRVGIARALYNDPEVLVLDEATSSLDNETEGKIMDEIYALSKDKTLIVVAHRLSTVERCKKRVLIEDGRIAG